jgi:hypothetical protein
MTRRARIRRVLKWMGMMACLAAVTLSALSSRYTFFCYGSDTRVQILGGNVWIFYDRPSGEFRAGAVALAAGWSWRLPHLHRNLPAYTRGISPSILVPLWLVLLVTAVPTLWLWCRDLRRFPAGHCCKCGYDLTGNVSGRCPECGRAVEAKAEGKAG